MASDIESEIVQFIREEGNLSHVVATRVAQHGQGRRLVHEYRSQGRVCSRGAQTQEISALLLQRDVSNIACFLLATV